MIVVGLEDETYASKKQAGPASREALREHGWETTDEEAARQAGAGALVLLDGLNELPGHARLVAVLVLAERGDHLDMARAVVDGTLHRQLAHEHILAGAGKLAHIDAVPLHEDRRGVLGVYGDWHRAGGVSAGGG
jgi:hypothetical protein